jgi:hypothetical protein
MSPELTDHEIGEVLEQLNYSSQTDAMAKKLFFAQTEIIRQQAIHSERIIEALKYIASSSPNAFARKEARKTLTYLGFTPLTNWPAIKTGAKIGFFTAYFALMILQITMMGFFSPIFIILDMIAALLGIPFGIIGAILGKLWLKTPQAVSVGGYLGIGLVILMTIIYGARHNFCFIVGGC